MRFPCAKEDRWREAFGARCIISARGGHLPPLDVSFVCAAARMTGRGAEASAVRSSLSRQLLQNLEEQNLVRPGDRVGVAVSGGADSVALLLLLLELRKELGIVLSVVHFNHKLRGKAADADEKFVANLTARHK